MCRVETLWGCGFKDYVLGLEIRHLAFKGSEFQINGVG